ncbi:hypothetical protein [Rubellimicrobium arenae]|uniref:hypothetical protein n=1 Tax=Rubellimicrobium arenae TaxID=2817372 RepID=UPI001B30523D|nr:hypothetical protein [Rubellimicrobium arenae]
MGARSLIDELETDDILEAVAQQAGMQRQDVSLVADLLFREMHKRQYETETDDYLCSRLRFDLSEFAWIHLYQFLVLCQLRSSHTRDAEDLIGNSIVQLQYLGGKSQWRKYFIEMTNWKMSSKYGRDTGLYS